MDQSSERLYEAVENLSVVVEVGFSQLTAAVNKLEVTLNELPERLTMGMKDLSEDLQNIGSMVDAVNQSISQK